MSQTITVHLECTDTIRVPSGVKKQSRTSPNGASIRETRVPWAISQTASVSSREPETMYSPFGDTSHPQMPSPCANQAQSSGSRRRTPCNSGSRGATGGPGRPLAATFAQHSSCLLRGRSETNAGSEFSRPKRLGPFGAELQDPACSLYTNARGKSVLSLHRKGRGGTTAAATAVTGPPYTSAPLRRTAFSASMPCSASNRQSQSMLSSVSRGGRSKVACRT